MSVVLLVIHLLIALALVGVILIQRSEGGALSGLGGGNFGGTMSGRGAANLLTRTTAILAASFMTTSMLLAFIAGHGGGPAIDLDAEIEGLPAIEEPLEPAEPALPDAPVR